MTAEDAGGRSDLAGLPAAYAAWRASPLGQTTDAIEQGLVLDLVGPPAGLRILDVGCGDGVLAVALAGRGARAAGVDPSGRMIAAARQHAARHGGDATFHVAEAEHLPLQDDAFDVVVAVTALCFVEDAEAALAEMTRVLRPGGRVVVAELGRYSSWAAIRRVRGWLGSPVWRRARFRSPAELERLARAANLEEVAVTGAIFYPPFGIAARLLGPMDGRIGACTTAGAAFLALVATKSRSPANAPEGGPFRTAI